MASRGKQKIEVQLRFNRKQGHWEALIEGKVHGVHRYERRALIYGVQNYAKELGVDPTKLSPVSNVEWTGPAEKIHKIFAQSKERLQQAERNLVEAEEQLKQAKREHKELTAEYVAALLDYGVSMSGAMRLADATTNTVKKYLGLAGGEQQAAQAMWKRAKVKIDGMLGRPKTPKTSSGESGGIDDIWSLYDQKE